MRFWIFFHSKIFSKKTTFLEKMGEKIGGHDNSHNRNRTLCGFLTIPQIRFPERPFPLTADSQNDHSSNTQTAEWMKICENENVIVVYARGEREQEVYKVIGETQVATLWAFSGRRFVWKYSDANKFCAKTNSRYTVMFSFNKYFSFPILSLYISQFFLLSSFSSFIYFFLLPFGPFPSSYHLYFYFIEVH